MAEIDRSAMRWLLIATTTLVVAIIASVTVLTILNKPATAVVGLIGVLVVPFVGAVLYSFSSKLDRVENKVDGVDVKVNGNLTNLLQMLDKFATSPTITIPAETIQKELENHEG